MQLNQVHCGDCLVLMQSIPNHSIDMVLCDLPYGTTQCRWDCVIPFDQLWQHYSRIVKHNGAILMFGAEPFSSMLRMSNISNYKYDWIWEKGEATGYLNSKKQPLRAHETISVFYQKQPTYIPQMTHGHVRKVSLKGDKNTPLYRHQSREVPYDSTSRYPRSVLRFSKDKQRQSLHPTQKPIGLCEYMIKTYTNEGDVVLDNCCGSGTTGVACKNLNRNFILIEKDSEYVEIARKRIADGV